MIAGPLGNNRHDFFHDLAIFSWLNRPSGSEMTKAGRLFTVERSENGNGRVTTSPFTNLTMQHPLQESPNLLRVLSLMLTSYPGMA